MKINLEFGPNKYSWASVLPKNFDKDHELYQQTITQKMQKEHKGLFDRSSDSDPHTDVDNAFPDSFHKDISAIQNSVARILEVTDIPEDIQEKILASVDENHLKISYGDYGNNYTSPSYLLPLNIPDKYAKQFTEIAQDVEMSLMVGSPVHEQLDKIFAKKAKEKKLRQSPAYWKKLAAEAKKKYLQTQKAKADLEKKQKDQQAIEKYKKEIEKYQKASSKSKSRE